MACRYRNLILGIDGGCMILMKHMPKYTSLFRLLILLKVIPKELVIDVRNKVATRTTEYMAFLRREHGSD